LEAILKAAGIKSREDPVESSVEVLRDGFPSYVIRVRPSAVRPAETAECLVVKACPVSSREPELLLHLHRNRFPVPAVLDVREGDGFRVIVMEDVGEDALHKHPDAEWYRAAVREIARIHVRSVLSLSPRSSKGARAALKDLVPSRTDADWAAIVREGLEGTLRRIDGGTYRGVRERDREQLRDVLGDLAEKTLAMIHDPGACGPFSHRPSAYRPFPNILVHGDYHDGNILIRTPKSGEAIAPEPPSPFAIVDWDSSRWDSGFFDLVSLFDVSERMGTFRLNPEEVIGIYLDSCADTFSDTDLCMSSAKAEWRRCRALRAWDELKWFSETGEDFGDRIVREIEIIRTHVG